MSDHHDRDELFGTEEPTSDPYDYEKEEPGAQQSAAEEMHERHIQERAALIELHNEQLRKAGFAPEEESPERVVNTFAPVSITVDINDLMTYFGMEYDEDGPTGNPNKDVRSQIMFIAAQKLVEQSFSYNGFKEDVKRAIDEHLSSILQDELQKVYRPTDYMGNPKGDPTTLAEFIGEQMTTFLRDSMLAMDSRGYDRSGHKGKLRKFIEEEVGRQFEGDLKKTVEEAKQTVLEAVRAKGAEFMAQAFADAAAKVQASTPSMTIGGTL